MSDARADAKRPLRHFAGMAFVALLGFSGVQSYNSIPALRFMPAVHAAEKGNFDYLTPQYHKATDTVAFETRTYTGGKRVMIDKDNDGIKETILERYNFGSTPVIIRYETKGKTWAWAIYRNYLNKRDARNYGVIDSDGKDGFDTKVRSTEPFGLPKYLKGPATRH